MERNKEGIGIGGVMAEVAWLGLGSPVHRALLVSSLKNRFDITEKDAEAAIDMAELCGVIEIISKMVHLKTRPK